MNGKEKEKKYLDKIACNYGERVQNTRKWTLEYRVEWNTEMMRIEKLKLTLEAG